MKHTTVLVIDTFRNLSNLCFRNRHLFWKRQLDVNIMTTSDNDKFRRAIACVHTAEIPADVVFSS